ncbi:ATP-binding protein [Lactococcus garvieae]|uniref:ATP-binding protein n=1 Tax=Lactococcus garvieae TaxID=1363 RepID=UPI003851FFD5
MRIKKVYLENFRGYKNKVVIEFDKLTAFIGKNDIGKSTILEGLDIFFHEGKNVIKIDKNDLCVDSQSDLFRIGICFEEFPKELIVDSTVSTSLQEEFLLNKDGLLEIRKDFKNGKVINRCIVANYPTEPSIKELHSENISSLKTKLQSLGLQVEDNRKSSLIRKKILEFYSTSGREETDIPIDKAGSKQIWEKLEPHLPLYELFQSDRKNLDQDDEVQNPVKVLINEILHRSEIENRLNEIFLEIKEMTKSLTDRTVDKLSEMNPEIAKELSTNFNSPNWSSVFKFSLDTDSGISLNKRGSGVRRLILLNFFRAEAERSRIEKKTSSIIYAFEEPETSQHPVHQKMLIEAFKDLAKGDNNQVILTTHSPSIAKMMDIDSLRYISKDFEGKVSIKDRALFPEILSNIAADLGVLPTLEPLITNEVKLAICVEGKYDIAFIKTLNTNLKSLNEIVNLDRNDIIFIPMGGSSLQYWVNEDYLGKLNLAQFHLYDSDIGSDKSNKYREYVRIINTRERCYAVETTMRELENYVPQDILKSEYSGLEDIVIDDWATTDIPEMIAEYVYNSSPDRACDWDKQPNLDKKKSKIGKVKKNINENLVQKITEDSLKNSGFFEEIEDWHNKIKTLLTNT